jgi:hypothetical protein
MGLQGDPHLLDPGKQIVDAGLCARRKKLETDHSVAVCLDFANSVNNLGHCVLTVV